MHTWSAGATSGPLSATMTAGWVDIVGDWPHTECQVYVRHRDYGELILRRRLGLFDEFGRPTEHLFPSVDVMEDLDTGYLPPVAEAVEGILDF
jgi:hypothetical protein